MGVFAKIGTYIRIVKMCINCPENTLCGETPHLCENIQYNADTDTISCDKLKQEDLSCVR